MNKDIKGFPPYGFSVVVKFGGSLTRNLDACEAALAKLERLSAQGHRILVVPGGGLPDKAIESVDAERPITNFTAHHACALAQDQTGYLLCDPALSQKMVPCATLRECRQALEDMKVPVLLPSKLLFTMDPVEWSWDITSDAVAAWIAWVTGTPKLAILTNVDGVYRDGAINDPGALISEIEASHLVDLGHTSIDACAVQLMAQRGISGVVMNGSHPDRLLDWLNGKQVIGTEITYRPVSPFSQSNETKGAA